MKTKSILTSLALLSTSALLAFFPFTMTSNEYSSNTPSDLADGLYAKMSTSKGDIVLKLHYQECPMTVCNFVGLAEGNITNNAKPLGTPFYDSLTFHRVIADFMIQGGDPAGNGSGGPGYQFDDECTPSLKHEGPGVLSMANAGPGTNGSQFFITHVATPWLDGKHTVFGRVLTGQEVVNAIQQGDVITHVEIMRIGKDAKNFKADDKAMKGYKEAAEAKAKEALAAAAAEFQNWVVSKYPNAKQTESGLWYVVNNPGTGKVAEKGHKVAVHYSGMLDNGSVFDNSYQRGEPIEFMLGVGQVIPGWDEGIALMKEGAKYTLIIPSNLGYGARGAGGVIPPNATLIFETELMKVY